MASIRVKRGKGRFRRAIVEAIQYGVDSTGTVHATEIAFCDYCKKAHYIPIVHEMIDGKRVTVGM